MKVSKVSIINEAHRAKKEAERSECRGGETEYSTTMVEMAERGW